MDKRWADGLVVMTTGGGTKAKEVREACPPMRRRSATRTIVLDTIAAVGVSRDDYCRYKIVEMRFLQQTGA